MEEVEAVVLEVLEVMHLHQEAVLVDLDLLFL
jgi:hypothetical protein